MFIREHFGDYTNALRQLTAPNSGTFIPPPPPQINCNEKFLKSTRVKSSFWGGGGVNKANICLGSVLYIPVAGEKFSLAGDTTLPTLLGYPIPFSEPRIVPLLPTGLSYEEILKWELFFLQIGLCWAGGGVGGSKEKESNKARHTFRLSR